MDPMNATATIDAQDTLTITHHDCGHTQQAHAHGSQRVYGSDADYCGKCGGGLSFIVPVYDVAPEVTAFFADARKQGNDDRHFRGDDDALSILDVLLTHFDDVHVAALMGLDDLVSLANDVQRVGRFLEVLARTHLDALSYDE